MNFYVTYTHCFLFYTIYSSMVIILNKKIRSVMYMLLKTAAKIARQLLVE